MDEASKTNWPILAQLVTARSITFLKNAWKNLCTESTIKRYFQKKMQFLLIQGSDCEPKIKCNSPA